MIELKSYFKNVEKAPADAILGLVHDFKADKRAEKINLAVGVYQTDEGNVWLLPSVKKAEEEIFKRATNKDYFPIDGDAEFIEWALELTVGSSMRGFQTPGGTGALRVGAEFLREVLPKARVFISNPSWPNHRQIFERAKFEVKEYPYNGKKELMFEAIDKMHEGDIIILQVSCHNPTGVDLTIEEWQRVSKAVKEKGVFPFFDFAYQGFSQGLEEDRYPIELFKKEGHEFFVAASFAKNFGLYGERVGLLAAKFQDEKIADLSCGQIRRIIRALYSNPPIHGALIVKEILKRPELRAEWEKEVALMRSRILEMRRAFREALEKKMAGRDFSHLTEQKGMFSLLDLKNIEALRQEKALYVPATGRISFVGLNRGNIDAVVKALEGHL